MGPDHPKVEVASGDSPRDKLSGNPKWSVPTSQTTKFTALSDFTSRFLHLHRQTTTRPPNTAKMGRVRTKTVKKSAKVIIERYYPKLTLDFETNKRICDEIAIIASKRLRNKVSKRNTEEGIRVAR